MVKIGLICAQKSEMPDRVRRNKHQIVEQIIGDCNIGSIVSGVGRRKAFHATKKLCEEFKPEYILCIGLSGSTDNDPVGSYILAESVVYKNREIPLGSDKLEVLKDKLRENAIAFKTGKIQTFDHPVLFKKKVFENVLAVEMELYGIAEVTRSYGIPLVAVRVISDTVPEKRSLSDNLFVSIFKNRKILRGRINHFFNTYFQNEMKAKVYYAKNDNRKKFAEKFLGMHEDKLGRKILIKPNHVSYEGYPTTTHPDMLEATIKYLKGKGLEIICGDGHAIDIKNKNIKNTPTKQVCEKYGVGFINFYETPMQTYKAINGWRIKMASIPFEVDCVISLPVLKSHPAGRFRMTGALKNVIGYFSRKERVLLHLWRRFNLGKISKDPWMTIAAANWLLSKKDDSPAYLTIMDGIETLIHSNEIRHGGKHAELGYLMAGKDSVALDMFGFSKLKEIDPQFKNKKPDYIKYIQNSIDLGVGNPEYDSEEIL